MRSVSMIKKILLGVSLLVVVSLLLCSPLLAEKQEKVEPIKIGCLFDYTGSAGDHGPRYEAGVRLALEEVNYQVAGRPIKLIIEDSATNVDTAFEKFKTLVKRDKVNIVIGPLMGDAHLAIAPYAAREKVIVTSLINGMYETIESKTHVIYPTTCDAQTYPLGKYLYEKGYRTMVTVGGNYAGKIAYINGAAKGFTDAGGTVIQQLWPPVGCPDYSPYIGALKKADVVLFGFAGPAQVSRFIYQYRQAGLDMPLATLTADSDFTPEALEEIGDLALGIEGQASYTWQLDNPENKKFVKAITEKTGKLFPSTERNTYTLMKIILSALKATGGDDSYEKLWPAILNTKINAPEGPVYFSPDGVAITNMYIVKVEKKDGHYVLSAPIWSEPILREYVDVARGWKGPKED